MLLMDMGDSERQSLLLRLILLKKRVVGLEDLVARRTVCFGWRFFELREDEGSA